MKAEKLNFPHIGKAHPVNDKDRIIWVFSQMSKQYGKAHQTRYWLNLLECYKDRLLEHQAYEVLEFLKSHVTDAQERRRAKYREAAAERAEKEWESFIRYREKWKMMNELKKMITPN